MSTPPGPPVPERPWFDEVASFLGPAYLRNAFTKGTGQEVDFLVDALALGPGMLVLDVGCGPGRHALELARRGIEVVGVDRSGAFVELATQRAAREGLAARFVRADVRALPVRRAFDAMVCLCQGGFGLLGGAAEAEALAEMVGRVLPGGRIAVSAFSAAFAVRFLDEGDHFDVATGVFHERALVRDEARSEATFDLWTSCFTPRELELLATANGVAVEAVHGVAPGRYGVASPTLEHPELLLLGRHRAPGFRSDSEAQ